MCYQFPDFQLIWKLFFLDYLLGKVRKVGKDILNLAVLLRKKLVYK